MKLKVTTQWKLSEKSRKVPKSPEKSRKVPKSPTIITIYNDGLCIFRVSESFQEFSESFRKVYVYFPRVFGMYIMYIYYIYYIYYIFIYIPLFLHVLSFFFLTLQEVLQKKLPVIFFL